MRRWPHSSDRFQADLKEATLITLYLTTYANERLKPKLRAEAKPGSRIVSHDFMINGWKPSRKENYNEHTINDYSPISDLTDPPNAEEFLVLIQETGNKPSEASILREDCLLQLVKQSHSCLLTDS